MTKITSSTSVLLVHDVVESFVDPKRRHYDADLPQVLDRIDALVAAARRAGVPVIFAAPGPGEGIGPRPSAIAAGRVEWGSAACDPPKRFGPLPGDIVLRKPRFGAFFGTRLSDMLKDMGREVVIVCGISLAGGVETTVRDANNHDFESVLVSDACLCRPVSDQGWGAVSKQEVEKVVLSIISQRFARVVDCAQACLELAADRA